MEQLSKEELQKSIDHYSALSEAGRLTNRPRVQLYYNGKHDAYVNVYDKLYPDMLGERAYPLNEKERDQEIQDYVDLVNKGQLI